MRVLLNRWFSGALCFLLIVAAFWWLWYRAVNAPDDAVREILIGSPDWYLAEHRVGPKAYYTLRSDRGNTPWDARFGNRPASLLYYQRGEDGAFLLQRLDGTVFRLDFRTGTYEETPPPSTPLAPFSDLFLQGRKTGL